MLFVTLKSEAPSIDIFLTLHIKKIGRKSWYKGWFWQKPQTNWPFFRFLSSFKVLDPKFLCPLALFKQMQCFHYVSIKQKKIAHYTFVKFKTNVTEKKNISNNFHTHILLSRLGENRLQQQCSWKQSKLKVLFCKNISQIRILYSQNNKIFSFWFPAGILIFFFLKEFNNYLNNCSGWSIFFPDLHPWKKITLIFLYAFCYFYMIQKNQYLLKLNLCFLLQFTLFNY